MVAWHPQMVPLCAHCPAFRLMILPLYVEVRFVTLFYCVAVGAVLNVVLDVAPSFAACGAALKRYVLEIVKC